MLSVTITEVVSDPPLTSPHVGSPMTSRLTPAYIFYTLLCAICTLFTATAHAKDAADSTADRPNILLIFADDIGYEALNCYGGLDFETPRFSIFVRRTHAFAAYFVRSKPTKHRKN